MNAMASQITSLTMVHPTVYSGTDERKHQSSASLAFCEGDSPVTGEIPAQRASNAENVSIWWRHHAIALRENICVLIQISLTFVPNGLTDIESASIRVMVWVGTTWFNL